MFSGKICPQEEWQTYSGAIDRFKFVEGFEYQIKVKETNLKTLLPMRQTPNGH
jgi:hypothetical protein